ncbi:mediator of RNA polymerase II transcription subunit 19a-like isoform X2 [Quercus robur]|uniref:mediator of RNA polymerase II transcription subunit 19a-like isoform X2 n=1 Tax=Quercus robur TaxID=38942 RepID=UPI0021638E61|nr:mediator of RNA polymerase II transcription subunit 19a-like isoform X2 [Quercus robur]
MDLEGRKFGRGPRELSGAVDLINQYKLWPHHEFFCKRPLPLSVSQTHYLRNVVGDTEIRRGEGMELDQLSQSTSYLRERNAHIHPFDLDALWEAFQMRETTPVYLTDCYLGEGEWGEVLLKACSDAEKGMPSAGAKSNDDSRDQKRKHKKHKDKDKKKDKDHKKHKHRHKDKSDDKDKNRDGHLDLKLQDKKRRHEGNGDLFDSRKHQKARTIK